MVYIGLAFDSADSAAVAVIKPLPVASEPHETLSVTPPAWRMVLVAASIGIAADCNRGFHLQGTQTRFRLNHEGNNACNLAYLFKREA